MYGSRSTKYQVPSTKSSLAKNQGGFIIIIAMGLFAIMAIFMIILQKENMRTLQWIKMFDNQVSAEFLGESALNWLQFKVNREENLEPFNYSSGHCKFTRGTSIEDTFKIGGNLNGPLVGDSSNPSFCQEIYDYMLTHDNQSQTVTLDLKVKGNMRSGDVLDSDECYVDTRGTLLTNNCYINPLPETGSAGENCKAYVPSSNPNIDPIDHPCNWNKLEFGSNMLDRVAIPLYYKEAGAADFIEPFFGQQRAQLAIKIRTPCKTNADAFGYCADNDRYVLDETEDDIVAQWQLSGMCGEEECTFVPTDVVDAGTFSSILKENLINVAKNAASSFMVIDSRYFKGFSTTSKEPQLIKDILISSLQKPILTLFLIDKLQSLNGRNTESVPYLEYQIVTGVPTATSKMSITAEVSVNGNAFKRTLTRNYMKGIIDFAVQN